MASIVLLLSIRSLFVSDFSLCHPRYQIYVRHEVHQDLSPDYF